MSEIIAETESVCPLCLQRLAAVHIREGNDIYLEKTCPVHGTFSTVVWRGMPDFTQWRRPKTPSFPETPITQIEKGCPYDCGLCPEHRQHTCSVLLEITQRCDLHCPVCFADSENGQNTDWSPEEVHTWLERLIALGGPFNLQFSGGEPCMRDDLPQLIGIAKQLGFETIQVNSNGLRIARDSGYVSALKQAGLSTVFLQFDGTKDEIYRKIRGRRLLAEKLAAIEQCEKNGIAVILVPTLIPGINTENIGEMILLGLNHMPTVRGIHFQPVSYFGRYPQSPSNSNRLTLPELMNAIERQTAGRMKVEHFTPPGCENAVCSFHGNFVLMPEGRLLATGKYNAAACRCDPIPAAKGAAQARAFVARNWSARVEKIIEVAPSNQPSFGEWDIFLARKRTHMFCVSAMAFQDAWTLDLNRLRDCCIHVASRDGRLIPFCAYNLTAQNGESIYRGQDVAHAA